MQRTIIGLGATPGSYECLVAPNTPGCKDWSGGPLDLEAAARVRAAADAAAAAEAAKVEAARLEAEAVAARAAAAAQAIAAAQAAAAAAAAAAPKRLTWAAIPMWVKIAGGSLLALGCGLAINHNVRRR